AAAAVRAAISKGDWIGAETESCEGLGTLFSMGTVLWVSTDEALARFENEYAEGILVELFREGRVAGADVKSLLHVVSPMDSSEPELFCAEEADPKRLFDCGVAGYLLDSSKGEYPAPYLAETYLSVTVPEPSEKLPRAALDAMIARMLVDPLTAKLEEDGTLTLFRDVEMPLLGVLTCMERRGLAVDPTELARQSAALGEDLDANIRSIHAQAGEEFNIDSPQQLSHVLFDVLGLPTYGLKKTRRGFYSTNASVLGDLAKRYPIVAEVLEYREKSKIKSTYLDALPNLISAGDRRIHTSLNQTVTATGRLSSSNPNLQNIPVRSELGRRVRQAFTVEEGNTFLAVDYSQIELRLLAHLSGDEGLIAAFCEGADFHSATAARVFGIPVEEVSGELRSRAKAVNFGIVYGQQAYGLSQSLMIPMAEAQEMIDRYFEAYPGVRRYLDETVAFARKNLWVATMFGRKRHIPDIAARAPQQRAFGERTAMNHPMQGSAADIIKIAMVLVEERLRNSGMSGKLILQIHDELDFEVREDEAVDLARLVQETMEGVVELRVPLLTEASFGSTWAEAK
ncbi:MAG: DNA polymerase I, partial [Atopobiaceae bacterium]|nr:DNA polymerase I [Atopobiaceae bacterium]